MYTYTAGMEGPDQTKQMELGWAGPSMPIYPREVPYSFETYKHIVSGGFFFWLCWGLTTRQPLWVILCRLPEKGRKEIEEIVEEMKERNREERGTGMKGKKQKK